jgi:hypothetical protein
LIRDTVRTVDAPDKVLALLCRYARAQHGDETLQPASLEGPEDWGTIYRLAQHHAVVPLVHVARCRLDEENAPSVREKLHRIRARSQFLVGELKQILDALTEAGVRALPIKGPVLTHQAFPDLRYRFSGDLDLLIRKEDLSAVASVLKARGYEAVEAQSPLRRRLRTLIHSQHTFRRGAAVFFLDVHTRIMPPLYAYNPDFDALWTRAQEVDVLGDPVRCLAPIDRLLMLCFQGVKNRWDRLKYVSDVAAALQADPVDGAEALARARSLASERALLLGTTLAHELLDAPLPELIRGRVQEIPAIQTLRERVKEALAHPRERTITSFRDRVAFQFKVQDRMSTRLRYAAFAAFRKVVDPVTGAED